MILSMPVKDVGHLVELWIADPECVKATFLVDLVGGRPIHVLGITNVLGSRDWPIKQYRTSYSFSGK